MRPHEQDPPTSPLWTSTCGRHEIHTALLKRLVQWPSGPKAEIRLYDCNLFKTVLLIIFITNLYRQKISTFYSVQKRNSGNKKRQLLCTRRRQDDVSGLLILIFCVDVHIEPTAGPPYPSICVHLSRSPLRVDVRNGWPILEKLKLSHSFATTILFRHTKLQSRKNFPSSQIKVFMKKSSCKNTVMSEQNKLL